MEHRCGYRRVIDVRVTVRTRTALACKATLCEVSASGGRIVCSVPLPLYSTVYVQFWVARDAGRSKKETLEAEVVRETDTGYALEWAEFAPEAARTLWVSPLDSLSDEPVVQIERQSMRK
jgi:hypothetical protein